MKDKNGLLNLLEKIGPRDLYLCDSCVKSFSELGFFCEIDKNNSKINFEGVNLKTSETIDGNLGVSAWDVLIAFMQVENIEVETRMTGIGFRFNDLIYKAKKVIEVKDV